ncbi:MAG: elongation factor P [Candidatus Latescibacteria bacterium 4484_7]|nr:MAG: elongation factor P [Candidatus Latescibacteria bacterium 4484_7]
MADTSDFRNGMILKIDGKLYSIVEFLHVKPGKGGAFVRTKLKQIPDGSVIDKTFRAGEKVEEVRIVRRPFQYLYNTGDLYYLMDQETYEQVPVAKSILEDSLPYLKENMVVTVLMDGDKPLAVELPTFVELAVSETEPGVRGDTAQGGSKSATLETGAVITVPLFIEVGDVVKVDTRTGRYIERV